MKLLKCLVLGLAVQALAGCAGTGKFNSPAEWVAESKLASNLILADKADVWSEPKTFNKGKPGEVEVRTKFIKHFGTTCVWDIEYKNTGSQKFDEQVTVVRPDQTVQYGHNASYLKMAPGETYTVSSMELRECGVTWGESKDLNVCATCGPKMSFINK